MSRIIKTTAIGILCLTTFVLGVAFLELVPFIAQKTIQTTISKNDLPISLKIRHVGLWGSDVSEIAVGTEKSFARLDSIRVDYSPASLWQKKLNKISLSGLELNLHFQDGKLVLPWQAAEEPQRNKTSSSGFTAHQLTSLHNLGEVTIDPAIINLSFEKGDFSIPASINVQFNKTIPRLAIVHAKVMLRGQQIKTVAEIDLDTMELKTSLDADSIDLIRFADLVTTKGLTATGTLALTSKMHLDLQPLSLISAAVSGKLEQADISFGDLQLKTCGKVLENQQPFLFNLTAQKEAGHLSATSLAIDGSVKAKAGDFDLAFKKSDSAISFDGNFSLDIPEQTVATALTIAPARVTTQLRGEADSSGNWQVEATSLNKPAFALSQADLKISARLTEYTLSASSKADKTSFIYTVELAPLTAEAANFYAQLPAFSISGETVNGVSKFMLPFNNLVVTNSGNFSSKAEGKILFNWPYQPQETKSSINIHTIHLADQDLGDLDLTLKQELQGFTINGRHQNSLLDTLCFDLTGYANVFVIKPEAEFHLKNACNTSINSLDLGRFAPNLSGFLADAELQIDGKLLYKDGRTSGQIDSKIKNIRLTSTEKDFTLEGGSFGLQLKELPIINSGPKQQFSFQSLKFGKITAANGLVEYQIESPESIFIEKSQFQWSDGHVYTPALRFSPRIKDYDLIFFCDRLHFAKLLDQLGVATSEGQGRVNGRVPVRITDGKFFLENGFLYSTPGEGGKIKLTHTDLLTDNIPEGTPQFAQIDLAREALKNFDYDWTKLDINSESAEDLLLHLQINGKPSNPLPFIYSQEFGGFARVDASSPGSHFQGIKLDVNFRLPLNQVLHYGDSMKSLMK